MRFSISVFLCALMVAGVVRASIFSLESDVITFGDSVTYYVVCADKTAFRLTAGVSAILCGQDCSAAGCGLLFTKPKSSISERILRKVIWVYWNDHIFQDEVNDESRLTSSAHEYSPGETCERALAIKCRGYSSYATAASVTTQEQNLLKDPEPHPYVEDRAVVFGTVSDSLPLCADDEELFLDFPAFSTAISDTFPSKVFVPSPSTRGPFLRVLPELYSFRSQRGELSLRSVYRRRVGLSHSSKEPCENVIIAAPTTVDNFRGLLRLLPFSATQRPETAPHQGIIGVERKDQLLCAEDTQGQFDWASSVCSDQGLAPQGLVPSFFTIPTNSVVPLLYSNVSFFTAPPCKTPCSVRTLIQLVKPIENCSRLLAVNCSASCEVKPAIEGSDEAPLLYGGFPLCGNALGTDRLIQSYCAVQDLSKKMAGRTRSLESKEKIYASTWGNLFLYPDDSDNPQRFITRTQNAMCGSMYTVETVPDTTSGVASTDLCLPFAINCSEWLYKCDMFVDQTTKAVAIHNYTPTDRTFVLSSLSYFDHQMQGEICRFWANRKNNSQTMRFSIPISELGFDVWKTFSTSPASCQDQECTADLMCNLAMEDPKGLQTEALGVECDIENWDFKIAADSKQVAALDPKLKLNRGDLVGIPLARPKVTLPDTYSYSDEWGAFSAETEVLYSTQYRFNDETALAFCQAEDPRYTHADALVGLGISLPEYVLFAGFHCLDYEQLRAPLQECQFSYRQEHLFAIRSKGAVGVRCGTEPIECPLLSQWEFVGAFCGDKFGPFRGKTLWFMSDKHTNYVSMLNASEQPYAQSSPPAQYRVPMRGYNCRLGYGESGQEAWESVLGHKAEGLLTAALAFQYNPLTKTDDTVIRITDTAERSSTNFVTCNSCPNSAPVGAYCNQGRVDLDYFVFDTDNGTDFYHYYPAQNDDGSRSAPCIANFSMEAGLPGATCNLNTYYYSEECQELNRSGFSFDIESGTFIRESINGTIPYRLCRPGGLPECPNLLTEAFCGYSQYSNERSFRFDFSNERRLVTMVYQSKDQTYICNEQPYGIRTGVIGCILDVMPFFNLTGCLAGSGLVGQAQGKQPVVYNPTEPGMLLNFLGDTFYLDPCRECVLTAGDTYCSVEGQQILSIKPSEKFGAQGVTAALPLDSGGVKETPVPCLFKLNSAAGTPWKHLRFEYDSISLFDSARSTHPVDTLKLCSSETIKPMRFCSGNSHFDVEVQILNALQLVFKQPSLPSNETNETAHQVNYFVKQSLKLYIDQSDIEALGDTFHPLFRQFKFITFLGDVEEGLLGLIDNFGYVRFPPCGTTPLTQVIGFPALITLSVATILYAVFCRFRFFRQLSQAGAARHLFEVADAPKCSSKLDLMCEEAQETIGSMGPCAPESHFVILKVAHLSLAGTGNDKAETILAKAIDFCAHRLRPGEYGNAEVEDVDQLIRKKGPFSALKRAAAITDSEGPAHLILSEHVEYLSSSSPNTDEALEMARMAV